MTATQSSRLDEADAGTSMSARLIAAGLPQVEAWIDLPLVAGMVTGHLEPEVFRHYLEQDYLYLRSYVRLYAKLAANAPDEHVEGLVRIAWNLIDTELESHRSLGVGFGCDFDAAVPTEVCQRYIDFLLDAAGDFGEGLIAALPCIWGYGVVAGLMPTPIADRYQPWADVYDSERYDATVAAHCALIDATAVSSDRAAVLFQEGLDLEVEFWNQRP